jgi:hypothetical protein
MLMAMKKIIPFVDGGYFHGINSHVRTPGACAYIRPVLDELNLHASKIKGNNETKSFVG